MALRQHREITPHEDYGFFGPDSVTWKVWGYPTSATIGFQRAVVVEELDPALIAAVDKTQDIFYRPRTRYDRTLRYFSMVTFGGSRSAAKVADVLVKIHSKAVGTEPLSGNKYDANDFDKPRDAHLELRARQAARVFGEGAEPSDEGLVESEPILGALA